MMMLKKIAPLVCALMLGLAPAALAAGPEKVLLDADMVESFDDGVAMIMLANAPASTWSG